MTAIWLIYCLNCYQFSWPNCYFCHYMFTSVQSFILEPGFCDSGEAWETTAFLHARGRGHGGERSVPGRSHGVLLGYTMGESVSCLFISRGQSHSLAHVLFPPCSKPPISVPLLVTYSCSTVLINPPDAPRLPASSTFKDTFHYIGPT